MHIFIYVCMYFTVIFQCKFHSINKIKISNRISLETQAYTFEWNNNGK